jgi:hypothetical protein
MGGVDCFRLKCLLEMVLQLLCEDLEHYGDEGKTFSFHTHFSDFTLGSVYLKQGSFTVSQQLKS